VFPPVPDIVRLAHGYVAKVLVDAAQLVAHRRIQMDAWDVDYLAFSGHKVYAPFGTGVLVARKGLLSFSATELDAIRASGEENIGGIAALGLALRLLSGIGFDVLAEEEQALLRRTLAGLAGLPKVRVHGTRDPASPRLDQKSGIVIFDVKGMLPGRVARELAERAGVGVRYGCHCAHLLIKRLLKVPRWAERLQYLMLTLASGMSLPGVVRVSFGLQTTRQDVDAFLAALADVAQRSPHKPFAREMQAFVDAASREVYAPLP
jgi:selenocysteine lyase/cysteine desulfurase